METQKCVLYDRDCIGCLECEMCDLDPNKICDNCGKCLEIVVENHSGAARLPYPGQIFDVWCQYAGSAFSIQYRLSIGIHQTDPHIPCVAVERTERLAELLRNHRVWGGLRIDSVFHCFIPAGGRFLLQRLNPFGNFIRQGRVRHIQIYRLGKHGLR